MSDRQDAQYARELKNSEAFNRLLERVKDRQHAIFGRAGSSDEEVVDAHRRIAAIDALEKEIKRMIDDGARAERKQE